MMFNVNDLAYHVNLGDVIIIDISTIEWGALWLKKVTK